MAKPEMAANADDICRADRYATCADAGADTTALEDVVARARARTGRVALDPALAQSLSLEALETLRKIALDGRTVFNVVAAAPAVLSALEAPAEEMQMAALGVLALTDSPEAQRGIAARALDAANPESLRIAAFHSLAESAKRFGNLLVEGQVRELVDVARDEDNLTMRTAAGKALGAQNIRTNQASEIIRSYHGG
jgi:hypothetical protein